MDYRLVEEKDCEAIFGLICSLEEEILNFDDFCCCYGSNLKNDRVFYLAAVEKEEIAGFISVHMNFLLHHAAMIAEIQELIVAPDHRGQKIGRELIERAGKMAAEKGCRQIEVCCNRKRNRAHHFYESCGMRNSHYKFCMKLK
ncbi:MAG: GNAT family N-acetyltransferase [Clostridiaceae bacterium]|nr:GNAT family N-acetyltransferase [Clostridiaceae bacterium]